MPVDIRKYKPAAKISIKGKETKSFLDREINLFGEGLNSRVKEKFYSELYILLSTGVGMKTALEIIAEEESKEKSRKIFAGIRDGLIRGSSFSESIQASGHFSPYEYHTIRIGEESGRINEVLGELQKFYTNQIKQRRKVIQTLSYPMLVTGAAFGAVFFMLKFIVPMFADVFKRFNSDLPGITKAIIRLSEAFSTYFPLFVLVVSGIVFFFYSQRKEIWFKEYSSRFLLALPVFGPIVRKIHLSRFCHSMNLLLSSETPLVTALSLIENMIQFYPLQKIIDRIKTDIIKGETLHESMSRFKIFDKRLLSLIKVGEEVNKLGEIFEKTYKQLNEEVEVSTNMLGTVIEPILIIFLGGMVSLVLIAMYLPLFKLGTAVGF